MALPILAGVVEVHAGLNRRLVLRCQTCCAAAGRRLMPQHVEAAAPAISDLAHKVNDGVPVLEVVLEEGAGQESPVPRQLDVCLLDFLEVGWNFDQHCRSTMWLPREGCRQAGVVQIYLIGNRRPIAQQTIQGSRRRWRLVGESRLHPRASDPPVNLKAIGWQADA